MKQPWLATLILLLFLGLAGRVEARVCIYSPPWDRTELADVVLAGSVVQVSLEDGVATYSLEVGAVWKGADLTWQTVDFELTIDDDRIQIGDLFSPGTKVLVYAMQNGDTLLCRLCQCCIPLDHALFALYWHGTPEFHDPTFLLREVSLEQIVEALQSDNEIRRTMARYDLAYYEEGREQIYPMLAKMMNDGGSRERRAAVDCVRYMRPPYPAAMADLEPLLKDQDEEVRAATLRAILATDRDGAPARVLSALADPSPIVQAASASAACGIAAGASFEDRSAISTVVSGLMQSANAQVRGAAALALGYCQEAAQPYYRDLERLAAEDSDATVQAKARQALRLIEQAQER